MATAVASAATSVAASVTIHPPASPFAELLRRSRFATYDPAIRQTYRSPSAHAHRGDWGLKRPIALRRRNAFISINGPFESHSQFIEWNHAENQVRFIRRIEEMGIKPRPMYNTHWDKAVGNAKFQLLLDSEFCPGEGFELDQEAEQDRKKKNMMLDLSELGKQGPGMYGAKRGPPLMVTGEASGQVTENIEAMSTKQFSRYLSKLRKLRPAFAQHLRTHDQLRGKSLYAVAQNHEAAHHRRFLQQHLKTEFTRTNAPDVKIEQQPHPTAALTYAHPTPLETLLHTKPQPGIILNPVPHANGRFTKPNREETFVASFGGLTATIPQSESGGKRPLLDVNSEMGVDQTRIEESIVDMRPTRIDLVVPPKVVGRNAQGLKAVRLEAQVTANEAEFSKDNPYSPGSIDYNTCPERPKKSGPRDFMMRPRPLQVTSSWSQPASGNTVMTPGKNIVSILRNLVSIRPPGSQEPSDGSEDDL